MNDVQNEGGTTPAGAPQLPAKSNKKWIIIGVVAILVLIFLGQMFSPERAVERMLEQSTGGEYDIDINRDGTVEVTGGDGENMNVTAGENVSLPKDWPASVPIMPGATITYALSANTQVSPVYNVTYTTEEPMSAVVEYYTRELGAAGWTIEANFVMDDATMITATNANEDGVIVNIVLGEGETTVALSVESK